MANYLKFFGNYRSLRRSILLGGIVALAVCSSVRYAYAQQNIVSVPATLKITSNIPEKLNEFGALRLVYQLSLQPGVGNSAPTVDLLICDVNNQLGNGCLSLGKVQAPWRSPPGRILQVAVPKATQSADIGLVACVSKVSSEGIAGCGRILARTTVPRPVAARYIVKLNSFTILHTRARTSDTVFAGLMGTMRYGQVPELANCNFPVQTIDSAHPIVCRGPFRIGGGDHRNGTHSFGNMTVGEFSSVPGKLGRLSFAYVLFNFGAPGAEALQGDSMRGNSQGAMRGQVLTLNQLPSRDFTANLNGPPWLGCDGPTAAGALRLVDDGTTGSLDGLTRSTGHHVETSQTYEVPSQAGCGGSPRYTVTWSLNRVGWP